MKVKVYLPHSFKTSYQADVIVGVDYGAFVLASKGIMMDYAIGDFDSTSKSELELIKQFSKKIIRLPIIKDQTDSEAAIMHLKDLGYSDITLIGDIGNRLDHLLINLKLVEKYQITYLLNGSKAFNLKKGIHKIKREYEYLSLFTSDSCVINLSGSKYPLSNQKIEYFDTYTSANEIIEEFAILEVLSGSVTVILSNDK